MALVHRCGLCHVSLFPAYDPPKTCIFFEDFPCVFPRDCVQLQVCLLQNISPMGGSMLWGFPHRLMLVLTLMIMP